MAGRPETPVTLSADERTTQGTEGEVFPGPGDAVEDHADGCGRLDNTEIAAAAYRVA